MCCVFVVVSGVCVVAKRKGEGQNLFYAVSKLFSFPLYNPLSFCKRAKERSHPPPPPDREECSFPHTLFR